MPFSSPKGCSAVVFVSRDRPPLSPRSPFPSLLLTCYIVAAPLWCCHHLPSVWTFPRLGFSISNNFVGLFFLPHPHPGKLGSPCSRWARLA